MTTEQHCREAAEFFDRLAAGLRVSPVVANAVEPANLLEEVLRADYRDKAAALRHAADKLEVPANA